MSRCQNLHRVTQNLENDFKMPLSLGFSLILENVQAKNKTSVVLVDWRLFNNGHRLKDPGSQRGLGDIREVETR